MGGWADLGQTGCPEIQSRDARCGQSLSPADVPTTPSTGGQRPSTPQLQTSRRSCSRPASRDFTWELLLTQHSASICWHLPCVFSALALRQPTPKAEVLSTPQAPLRKQNGEMTLSRTLRGGDDSLLITDQGTEVSNHLPLCLSHPTCGSQDSISASPV